VHPAAADQVFQKELVRRSASRAARWPRRRRWGTPLATTRRLIRCTCSFTGAA